MQAFAYKAISLRTLHFRLHIDSRAFAEEEFLQSIQIKQHNITSMSSLNMTVDNLNLHFLDRNCKEGPLKRRASYVQNLCRLGL